MIGVDSFRKVPTKIPYKSGFDKSHRFSFSSKTGTLTPVLVDELMPNQDTYVRCPFVVRMPPLASDTFMNVDYKLEAFFVPTRLLMAGDGYERFMTGNTTLNYGESSNTLRSPLIVLDSSKTGSGTLADYLGWQSSVSGGASRSSDAVCAYPFLAYALVWDTWYRSSLIQQSLFPDAVLSTYTASSFRQVIPSDNASVGYLLDYYGESPTDKFADGSSIYDLRQRNFGCDYFTVATPNCQNGPAMGVNLTLNTEYFEYVYNDAISGEDWDRINSELLNNSIGDGGVTRWSSGNGASSKGVFSTYSGINANQSPSSKTGGFTIASLRAANAMQQFLEINNLSGERFQEFLRANYGADLSDGIAQRPVYLGSASYPVYTSGVLANGAPDGTANNANNPFQTVGAAYGSAHAEGNDFVVKFHNDEPGYLLILGSLVPEVSYSGGIERYFMRYVDANSRTDMANHLLQKVGPQPIYCREAQTGFAVSQKNNVFGYVDRYADWMTRKNRVAGLLHDGSSLESFALQRSLTSASINSAFLTIPTTFLDQVMAVTDENAGFSYWADFYFEYKVSMPLARYSVPSLQDPAYEHGDTVWLNRGGVRIQ